MSTYREYSGSYLDLSRIHCFHDHSLLDLLTGNHCVILYSHPQGKNFSSPIFSFKHTSPPYLGFPGGSVGKESACNAGDLDSIPVKIPWRRSWQPTPVFLPGESPWAEEPSRLQSMGSQRAGHWATKNCYLLTLGKFLNLLHPQLSNL